MQYILLLSVRQPKTSIIFDYYVCNPYETQTNGVHVPTDIDRESTASFRSHHILNAGIFLVFNDFSLKPIAYIAHRANVSQEFLK